MHASTFGYLFQHIRINLLCWRKNPAYGPVSIINYRDVLTLSIEIIDIYYVYESHCMAHFPWLTATLEPVLTYVNFKYNSLKPNFQLFVMMVKIAVHNIDVHSNEIFNVIINLIFIH
jgi:hypothetical protein